MHDSTDYFIVVSLVIAFVVLLVVITPSNKDKYYVNCLENKLDVSLCKKIFNKD